MHVNDVRWTMQSTGERNDVDGWAGVIQCTIVANMPISLYIDLSSIIFIYRL